MVGASIVLGLRRAGIGADRVPAKAPPPAAVAQVTLPPPPPPVAAPPAPPPRPRPRPGCSGGTPCRRLPSSPRRPLRPLRWSAVTRLPAAAASATPSAPPPRMVGGSHRSCWVAHVVAFHTIGKATTSFSDQFTLAVPIGVTVHLNSDWVFDFETIVGNDIHRGNAHGGALTTGLTVDPGVVYVGGPVALGLRVKWDIGSDLNFGIIPLIHKGIVDIGEANWFIEAAFPITLNNNHNPAPVADTTGLSVAIVAHTGIAF